MFPISKSARNKGKCYVTLKKSIFSIHDITFFRRLGKYSFEDLEEFQSHAS